MEDRWKQVTNELFSSPDATSKWWDRICQALSNTEGKRPYYNLENLERRFTLFDEFLHRLNNPTAVACAMFLQHLHYDPCIHGINEELTLATLEDFTGDIDKAAYEVVRDLRELIEAALINSTPVHLTPNVTGNSDVHYFLDIEMAALGSSPTEYAEQFNCLKMKEEYGFSSDVEFFRLRLKVLGYFLQIPNIYATEEFRNRYDKQARSNITKEIQNIEDRLKNINSSK